MNHAADDHAGTESPVESPIKEDRATRRSRRTAEPLYLRPEDACARWGVKKTSLYKALNGKLPGCERLPPIIVVKFGAMTLIHVPSGDAFFAGLPRYGSRTSDGASAREERR